MIAPRPHPMTPNGLRQLHELMKRLKTAELPAAIQALTTARAHGDLSENAEYDAAKAHHEQLLKQISDLERKIASAQVIDPTKLDNETVVFGATVQLRDLENDDAMTYQLVGVDESDIRQGKISIESPIGRALVGKGEGDEVKVKTPKGSRAFEILKIRYM